VKKLQQGMSAQKTHAERINSFKDNQAIRVMLLSALKQSTGLTLTQANHVVLMDHIEKSSEDQAIGRYEL
jgi:SNF2 family DNA or RNA helicase